MRKFITCLTLIIISFGNVSFSFADVVTSDEVMKIEQSNYSKQQMLSYIDSDVVRDKLIALGVDTDDAKARVANMTDAEISALNMQMQDMPAGGIVGTVVTVLVVIALLDMLGVTDVFSFIDPIF